MGIRVDAHHASQFERLPVPTPIEVEAPRIGVDLHCNAVLCTRTKDLFDVYVIAWPPQELATRHMTKDRGARVGYGGKDALSLFFPAEIEPAMHTGHDKVEANKDSVRVVQGPIHQDV
jgi:hypothetical protein